MPLTIDDLKAQANITIADDDAILLRYLNAATAHIQNLLGFSLDTYAAAVPPQDVPADIELAILLLATDWYDNREASVVGVAGSTAPIPFGVREIINEYRTFTFGIV